MMERMLNATYMVVAAIAYWSLTWKIYQLHKTKWGIAVFAGGATLIFACHMLLSPPVIVTVAFEIIVAVLAAKDAFWQKLINVLIAFFLVGIVEDIFRIIIIVFLKKEETDLYASLVGIILTALLFLVIYRSKFFSNILLQSGNVSIKSKLLCLLTMVVTMSMISFGISMLKMSGKNGINSVFLCLALATLMLECFLMYELCKEFYKQVCLKMENEIKESVITEQKAVYNLMLEKNNETRMFRHDIRNHLATLGILLEANNTEKAKAYLREMSIETAHLNIKQVYYGNEVLDVVIAMMCVRAKEKGIEIAISGEMCVERLNVYDICGIFINAIGNALEACASQGNHGVVEVRAKKSDAMQIISISNPATEEMYDNVMKERTSKSDGANHGYGIKSIRRNVKKLGGNLKYHYDKGRIYLDVNMVWQGVNVRPFSHEL